jgi:hypothetical protein
VRESRYREPEFWLLLAILLLMVHSFVRVWGVQQKLDRLEKRLETLERMTPGATEYR